MKRLGHSTSAWLACIASTSALVVAATAFAAKIPPANPTLRVIDSNSMQVGSNLAIVPGPRSVDGREPPTISVILVGSGLPGPTLVELNTKGFAGRHTRPNWVYKDDLCAGQGFLFVERAPDPNRAPLVVEPEGMDQGDFLFPPVTGAPYSGTIYQPFFNLETGIIECPGFPFAGDLATDFVRVPTSNFGVPPFRLAP